MSGLWYPVFIRHTINVRAIWKGTEISELRFSEPYAVARRWSALLVALAFLEQHSCRACSSCGRLYRSKRPNQREAAPSPFLSHQLTFPYPSQCTYHTQQKLAKGYFLKIGKKNVVLKELHRSIEKMVTFMT